MNQQKQIYNILKSGSSGNCVIYLDMIAVDMGVPFKLIEPYKKQLKLVLYTHFHTDHLNKSTLKRLAFEHPGLRFAGGEFLSEYFEGIKNFDVLEAGKIYDYGLFKVSPVKTYHDCPSFGFRIFQGETKIIHITDSYTLEGISAPNYSLYALEHNYCEEMLNKRIEEKQKRGEFAYEIGSRNSHLSEQQAKEWLFENMNENSQVIRLHESKNNF